jgi:hypothetical protein
MVVLMLAGFAAANLILLARLWLRGRRQRRALRDRLDTIRPLPRRRRGPDNLL